jgi:hypothetical protein
MRRYLTENVFNAMDYYLQHNDELTKMTFKYAREYMSTRVDVSFSDQKRKILSASNTPPTIISPTRSISYFPNT